MLDDYDRTLSETNDIFMMVDYDSDSEFSNSEPTSSGPLKDCLHESVSKTNMSEHEEKAKIVH